MLVRIKTKCSIFNKSKVACMLILDYLHTQVEAIFKNHPYRFFTEHDIHSELALIATAMLQKQGSLYSKTKDGFVVSRIHHEYPTPFRCDMKDYNFRMVTEEEFNRKRREKIKIRARRGFIDFVVLNLDFISSNNLGVVSGKRYSSVLSSLRSQKYPALDLAVEVVYYPTFDEKSHKGIMQRRVNSTVQDYKKLVAIMDFRCPTESPFCKEAAMLFFSNTAHEDTLKNMFHSFPEDKKVQLIRISKCQNKTGVIFQNNAR